MRNEGRHCPSAPTAKISSPLLSATISLHGAQLLSLSTRADYETLWQRDPLVWPATAPILFPVIGRASVDNVIRHRGRIYPMPMHGFAATRPFVLARSTQDGITLRLDADDETLASYPFDFSLEVEYRLEGAEFGVCATVTNRGSEVMPFGFGFHPGFKWPMPGFGMKTDYVLRLDRQEAAMLRQIRNGILQTPSISNPMRNGILELDERLFPFGAMLLPHAESRTVEYGTRDHTMLSVSFENLNSLALWTRRPGDFFCIEPWRGFPDEEDFYGEIAAKSQLRHLEPNQEASYSMRIRVLDALLSV